MTKDPTDRPSPECPKGDIPDCRTCCSAASPAARPAVRFEEIFCLDDIQRIQDAFAEAADVASLITDPEGRPLTRPSNFTVLCRDIIRQTAIGRRNCLRSDAHMGTLRRGPTILPCLSGGLLDGGNRIYFGDQHIANWLVGQVLDENVDEETVLAYGREIGADEAAFAAALKQVPRMPRERFAKICQALFQFADHLSALAVRNYRQARLITELRQAQAHIKFRDRNLADIIDFLPDPTLVVDKEGRVLFWNKELEKLTGVAAVEMLGKGDNAYAIPFYGVRTPLLVDYARGAASLDENRYDLLALGDDEVIAEADLPALPGGPKRVWAKAVALRDEAGAVTGAIEAIRDVTKRHLAETALRESEEKFRRIVETAHEGVWVFDANGNTSFANQRMAEMLGYAPHDMFGKKLETFTTDGSIGEAVRHCRQQRLRHGDVIERRMQRRDGSTLWAIIAASPLHDPERGYLGAVAMFTDITGRKEAEEELRQQQQHLEAEVEARTRDLHHQAMELAEANIRLSELDRLKSVFLSTVSHELRTPLTSILGFAKLIGREFGEQFLPLAVGNPILESKGRRIADNLSVVYHEAERLTRLINDVLDLSRIESGSMLWRDSRINPVEVLARAAKSIEGLLAQRPEIVFRFEAEGEIPALLMDPDQLLQVMSNLLQNAVKFTAAGKVGMSIRRDGDCVLIAVHDEGLGIPEEQLESIFERFHQVGRGDTVADTVKGTGLGLTICRQIVHHYGGRIWAESEPGRGSVFYVRLPLGESLEPDAARPG